MINCLRCNWEGDQTGHKVIKGLTNKLYPLPCCPVCKSERLDYSKDESFQEGNDNE